MLLSPLKLQWLEEQQGLQILYLLLLLLIPSLLLLKLIRSAKKPNLPPSPPKLPFIGNLHQLGTFPHRSLAALSHKYGPLMLLQLGSSSTLVVSSAEIVEEITKSQDAVFSDRPRSAVGEKIFYGFGDIGFAPYGEYWRQVRKFCVHELLSVRRVQSFKFVREEEVGIMIEKISHSCRMGNSVNITDLVLSAMHNVICRVTLGGKYHDGQENSESKIWQLTREVAETAATFYVGDYFPLLGWIDRLTGLERRTNKTFKALDAFFDQVIQEHLTAKKDDKRSIQEDFVDLLLQADKDSTFNIPLTQNNIKAILLDMFIAGTNTTAATVEWAMSMLIKNPMVLKKAQEDIRRIMGKKSRVEEDDICQMDYLKSIIKETLRLYPPGPLLLPRQSTRDTDLNGYHIPSKTTMFINAWAIQRDPKLWANPEEFIPERFTKVDFKDHGFKYIPFGIGRRSCPGMSFALASSELFLANLLYWFDWELPQNVKREDLDTEAPGVALVLAKKYPLYLLPKSFPF